MSVGGVSSSCCCAPPRKRVESEQQAGRSEHGGGPQQQTPVAPTDPAAQSQPGAIQPQAPLQPQQPATAPQTPAPQQNPLPTQPGLGQVDDPAVEPPIRNGGPTDVYTTPPAPQPGTQPGAPAAGQLPTWPQWEGHFRSLQVSEATIAELAATPLDDQQLSTIFRTFVSKLPGAGQSVPGTPGGPQSQTGQVDAGGQTPQSGSATGGWNEEWAKKFAALPLKPEDLAQIEQDAIAGGATDEQIQAAYDSIVAEGAQSQPTAGWSPEWEERFRKLGMPKEIIEVYASVQAPEAGIEAAYKNTKERVEKFRKDGWYDKLEDAGAKPQDIWGIILADQQPKSEEIEALVNQLKVSNAPSWKRWSQTAFSLVPGAELLQYAAGRKFITGETIDQSSPWNITMAALSGIAGFTAARGIANLRAGFGAIKTGGIGGLQAAQAGAAQSMSTFSKVKALFPRTIEHQMVVGAGKRLSAANALQGAAGQKLAGVGIDKLGLVDDAVVAAGGPGAQLSNGVIKLADGSTIGNARDLAMRALRSADAGELQILSRGGYLPKFAKLPFKVREAPITFTAKGAKGASATVDTLKFGRSFSTAKDGDLLLTHLAKGEALRIAPKLGLDGIKAAQLGDRVLGTSARALGTASHSNPLGRVSGFVFKGPIEDAARAARMVERPMTPLMQQVTRLGSAGATNAGRMMVGSAAAAMASETAQSFAAQRGAAQSLR